MKYTGDVDGTLNKILEAFESGNLPARMAQVFVTGAVEKHCNTYSFMNRFVVMLHGYSDARGYGQWKKIGRHVKKGEKGFAILAPIMVKKRDIDGATSEVKERSFCIGFKAVKVFGLEQTDGKPVENGEGVQDFLDTLPLQNVAEKWGIQINAYNGKESGALGFYTLGGQQIALGTKNLSTWAHELCHASDDKLGTLTSDKRWVAEVAAELSGAVLLEAIGYKDDSDRGGAWDYISTYAKRAGVEPIDACRMVIGRVGKIVQQILDTANEAVEA